MSAARVVRRVMLSLWDEYILLCIYVYVYVCLFMVAHMYTHTYTRCIHIKVNKCMPKQRKIEKYLNNYII